MRVTVASVWFVFLILFFLFPWGEGLVLWRRDWLLLPPPPPPTPLPPPPTISRSDCCRTGIVGMREWRRPLLSQSDAFARRSSRDSWRTGWNTLRTTHVGGLSALLLRGDGDDEVDGDGDDGDDGDDDDDDNGWLALLFAMTGFLGALAWQVGGGMADQRDGGSDPRRAYRFRRLAGPDLIKSIGMELDRLTLLWRSRPPFPVSDGLGSCVLALSCTMDISTLSKKQGNRIMIGWSVVRRSVVRWMLISATKCKVTARYATTTTTTTTTINPLCCRNGWWKLVEKKRRATNVRWYDCDPKTENMQDSDI